MRAARAAAVLCVAVVCQTLVVASASASHGTFYRTPDPAGSGAYRTLAEGPGRTDFRTSVDHGANRGTFLFQPGVMGSTLTTAPGSTPSGRGWLTPQTLSGTVPAGTWTFNATIDTDVPAGAADGKLLVAAYAIGGGGSRRILVEQGTTNVLSGPGTRSVAISVALPEVVLSGERLAVEWYLAIATNRSSAAGSSTALRQGASGDTVVLPGPLAAPALGPPGQLTVTSVGDNRIGLSWGASSDSRVTGYVVRRATGPSGPWTEVATVGTTSYPDTGLVNGTRYYHTVVAVAADGRRSAPSNATSAVPADDTAPSPPGSVSVAADGSFRLRVTWSPSGAADVAGYEVQRSGSASGPFTTIAGPLGATSHVDDGLPSGSTWYYRIVAVDDDGLRSAPSATAVGTVAPSPPSGLRVTAVADGAVALEWNGSDEPVANYILERSTGGGFRAVATPNGTSYTDSGLTNGTTYRYRVRAQDAGGGISSPSGTVTATPQNTGVPAPPSDLTTTGQPGDRVRLDWRPSISSSVVGYRVLRSVGGQGFTDVSGLVTRTRFDDGPLTVGVQYHYRVVAETASGTRSIPATTSYTLPPAAPGSLRVVAVSETTAQLAWTRSNDPNATYRVLRSTTRGRDHAIVSGAIDGTTFTDGGLVLGQTYYYVVRAESRDGTLSGPSNEVSVRPQNGPPTPPLGLTVRDTGTGDQLSLSWDPNPEPDLARYRVERTSGPGSPFTVVGEVASNGFLDAGLRAGTTYAYRVRAIDQLGTVSDPSSRASGTPTDTTPPAAPGRPTAVVSGTAIVLQWPATPDAAQYRVLRGTASGGPYGQVGQAGGVRRFTDDGVVRGTTYYYVVQAVDAAGNVSPNSPEASARVRALSGVPTPGSGGGGGGTGGVGGDGPVAQPPGGTGGTPGPGPGGTPGTTDGPTVPGGSGDDVLGGPDAGEDGNGGGGRAGGGGSLDVPVLAVDLPGGGEPPELSDAAQRANEALRRGELTEALGRTAEDVAGNVGEVARTFRVPLVLLLILALYLVVQGRIDRGTLPRQVEVATGSDDDDVEYIL